MINMDKDIIFFKIEPELKKGLKEIAKNERRTLTSIILPLIEKRLGEVKNASKS
jgi:predicted DNA-binding protein